MKTHSIQTLLDQAHSQGWSIGICAKVVDEKGNILLLERSASDHCAGVWEMPGGSLEPGEELLEGVQRELMEEINLGIVSEPAFVSHFDFHNIETGKYKRKFCFQVTVGGTPKLSEDHSDFRYFSPPEISQLVVEGQAEPYQIFRDHYILLTTP